MLRQPCAPEVLRYRADTGKAGPPTCDTDVIQWRHQWQCSWSPSLSRTPNRGAASGSLPAAKCLADVVKWRHWWRFARSSGAQPSLPRVRPLSYGGATGGRRPPLNAQSDAILSAMATKRPVPRHRRPRPVISRCRSISASRSAPRPGPPRPPRSGRRTASRSAWRAGRPPCWRRGPPPACCPTPRSAPRLLNLHDVAVAARRPHPHRWLALRAADLDLCAGPAEVDPVLGSSPAEKLRIDTYSTWSAWTCSPTARMLILSKSRLFCSSFGPPPPSAPRWPGPC